MKFEENIPLAQFSSYKIGGRARYFFAPKNVEEVKSAITEWQGRIFILGGGTNLLINDQGFDGLVLRPDFQVLETKSETIRVGAGVLMRDLLDFTIKKKLSGLEWAGGLPGTLGGAIRGNAGAFGGEIKDAVESVTSFDTKGMREVVRSLSECGFGYRTSVFKELDGREIILTATLRVKYENSAKIRKAIQEKIDYRKARHPMEYPNIGSIFKNVDVRKVSETVLSRVKHVIKADPFPVVPAAYLISEVGLKGVSFGGAMISPKHPNFIVNVMGATASDIRALRDLVRAEVKREFGIELEQEVEEV